MTATFASERFRVVHSALQAQTVTVLALYARSLLESDEFLWEERGSSRWFRYNDPFGSALAEVLRPCLVEIVGHPLATSYTYLVVYPPGSALPRHIDRNACEISVSISIEHLEDGEPSAPWPLWLSTATGDLALALDPGDLVVYRGREVEHFRETLGPGRQTTALFLHFVEPSGPLQRHVGDASHNARRRAYSELIRDSRDAAEAG